MFYLLDMTMTFRAMGRSHWRYLTGASIYFVPIACFWVLGSML